MVLTVAMMVGIATAEVPPEGRRFVPNEQESRLYQLIRDAPEQQRVQIILDPRLCQAARQHALDTQARRYFSHTNPEGQGANGRASNQGYPLPANYPADQNYIESLAGSVVGTPDDALLLWRTSPSHANHVFGKLDFYRSQVVIGVGYAPATRWHYSTYVFLSAPPPVGEVWAFSRPPVYSLEVANTVKIKDARPQSIFEVWSSTQLSGEPRLDSSVVIGSEGGVDLGPKEGPSEFYRLAYFSL